MHDVIGANEWSKKHTAPVTQQVVEAYLNDGVKRIVIDLIECGGSAAGDLQILDDTNTAVDGYFFSWGAGMSTKVEGPLKGLPINRGLRYTTGSGGNHNVVIKYHFAHGNL